jgi:uncharacterized membrane protein YidH (DUF202 family)
MVADLTYFLSGVFACASGAIALAFQRFWRRSGDRFFFWFAVAFALLAIERVGAVLTRVDPEATATLPYVLRLLAFLLIIVGIVEKNR